MTKKLIRYGCDILIVLICLIILISCEKTPKSLSEYTEDNIDRISSSHVFQAVTEGDTRVISLLVKGNIPLQFVNEEMNTPLFHAYQQNQFEVFKLLLIHPQVDLDELNTESEDIVDLILNDFNPDLLARVVQAGYSREKMLDKIVTAFGNGTLDSLAVFTWMNEQKFPVARLYGVGGSPDSYKHNLYPVGWSKSGKIVLRMAEKGKTHYLIVDLVTDQVLGDFEDETAQIPAAALKLITTHDILPVTGSRNRLAIFPIQKDGHSYNVIPGNLKIGKNGKKEKELVFYCSGIGGKIISQVDPGTEILGYYNSPFEPRVAVLLQSGNLRWIVGAHLKARFTAEYLPTVKATRAPVTPWIAPPITTTIQVRSGGSPGAEFHSPEVMESFGLSPGVIVDMPVDYPGQKLYGWTPHGELVLSINRVVDSQTGESREVADIDVFLQDESALIKGLPPSITGWAGGLNLKTETTTRDYMDPAFSPSLLSEPVWCCYSVNPLSPGIVALFQNETYNYTHFRQVIFCNLKTGDFYPGLER